MRERWFYKVLALAEKHLGGHVSVGPVTVYGFNAMHVAVDVRTPWGYVCAHPTVWQWVWRPWYVFVSPNATPGSATWGVGPGFER